MPRWLGMGVTGIEPVTSRVLSRSATGLSGAIRRRYAHQPHRGEARAFVVLGGFGHIAMTYNKGLDGDQDGVACEKK